jgi:uncharacterized membrane protein
MTTYNRLSGTSVQRIEALSDALFAFALTLTVLEVRVTARPTTMTEDELRAAVFHLGPRVLTYLLSFMTLGIFWVGQQTFLNHVRRSDRHLTWLLLAYLAVIALMPLSTGLLANYLTYRTALILYWLNILVAGLISLAAVHYGERAGLVDGGIGEKASAALKRRLVIGQALYAFGAALCVIHPYWSITFMVIVQAYFAFAPQLSRRGRRVGSRVGPA